SPLREISKLSKSNTLLPIRDAWWYVPSTPMQANGMPSQGSTSFRTENPSFGATFTYYLSDLPETAKAKREATEKQLNQQNTSIPFPGWDKLRQESLESEPKVMLLVKNKDGEAVRWIEGSKEKGLHRVNWDLKLSAPDPISLNEPEFKPPWVGDAEGPLAAPGQYSAELFIVHNGSLQSQGAAQNFMVKPVHNLGVDFNAVAAFQKKTSDLSREIYNVNKKLSEASEKLTYIKAALLQTPSAAAELFETFNVLNKELSGLRMTLTGDRIRGGMNESTTPSIMSRVGNTAYGHWSTSQLPTETHKHNIEIAEAEFQKFQETSTKFFNDLAGYESALEKAGAPWTPGRKLE
ncbi:MAG: glycosyl hydrolase, partial [Fulvivirga sp.]